MNIRKCANYNKKACKTCLANYRKIIMRLTSLCVTMKFSGVARCSVGHYVGNGQYYSEAESSSLLCKVFVV